MRKRSAIGVPASSGAPPDGLSEREAELWARVVGPLAASGVYTPADCEMARLLVEALAERGAAREAIAREGAVYEAVSDRGGRMLRPHPQVAIAEAAARRAQRALAVFARRVRPTDPPDTESDVAWWRAKHRKQRSSP